MKYYQYAPGEKDIEEAEEEYKQGEDVTRENEYSSYSSDDRKNW